MKLKFIRTAAIIGIVGILLVVIALNSSTKQTAADQVWDKATTVGSLDAKNYYVMYTDIMCPYCDVFSRLALENWNEFEQYLADNDILFEVRLTDYLYEGSDISYSRDAAEAAYCAIHEDKFWEFYHGAIASLWKDYHSKGVGDSKSSPAIKNLPADYWLKIGHAVGLGETFDHCVANHDTVDEIETNTRRALQVASGMPTFKFNRFMTSGFDPSWDWSYVLRYLDAGLENK